MCITKEKFEILAKYIVDNEERAKALTAVSAEEACEKINADGYDFTADELVAFAEEMEKLSAQQTEELGAEDLGEISGGCPILGGLLIASAVLYWASTSAKGWLNSRNRRR